MAAFVSTLLFCLGITLVVPINLEMDSYYNASLRGDCAYGWEQCNCPGIDTPACCYEGQKCEKRSYGCICIKECRSSHNICSCDDDFKCCRSYEDCNNSDEECTCGKSCPSNHEACHCKGEGLTVPCCLKRETCRSFNGASCKCTGECQDGYTKCKCDWRTACCRDGDTCRVYGRHCKCEVTDKPTMSTLVSLHLAKSLCKQQKKYVLTSQLQNPVKSRAVAGLTTGCGWYVKESGSSSDFSMKSCEEIGAQNTV